MILLLNVFISGRKMSLPPLEFGCWNLEFPLILVFSMKVIRDPRLFQRWSLRAHTGGKRLALVPTMGALHAGHASLIRLARKQSDTVIVSLYVNPAQFGPKEDLSRYPRAFAEDAALCRREKVSVLFAPQSLYTPGSSTWVTETDVSLRGEGDQRPGHFQGVATVVLKLLNLAQPHVAVFGQKDAQQLQLIRRMVRDLDVPVKIVAGEIVRDTDGLALSSRNAYLSKTERDQAGAFPLLLHVAAQLPNAVSWLSQALRHQPGLKADYVEVRDGRLCAAVRVGNTRLLDNVAYTGKGL
jgi:pantoate--beta-alanine ligase